MNEAHGAQNSMSSFLKEKLVPVIEKVAEQLSVPGEIIRVERMELDFNNFIPGGDNSEALREFEKQVTDQLLKLIAKVRPEDQSEKILNGIAEKGSEKTVKSIAEERADEELFIFIIREGTLPWWAETTSPIVLQALAGKVLEQPSAAFKAALLSLVTLPAARKRIAFKLPIALIEKLIRFSFSEPEALLKMIEEIALHIQNETAQPLTIYVRQVLFEAALNYAVRLPGQQLLISNLLKIHKNENTLPVAITKALEIIKEKSEATDVTVQAIKKIVTDEEKESSSFHQPHTSDNEYFVKNAGLVILCPYLPQFFKSLGLMQNNDFVTHIAQERAVYLLQYLSTGDDQNFEEHDMILNKVLCGMNLLMPLTLTFELQENEKKECYELLKSVTTHWTALKNTSPESMRDTFFMREGILEEHANGWNLKIERTTLDVLVDKLPWGISIIKLPWSTEIIFVNW